MDRYSRQVRFALIGEAGQKRLLQSRVALVGCGALGSVIAETLVRAGVGFLRIIDRDFLELNNLQRQVLFDEQDVRDHLPKAIAAQRKLAGINSDVAIEAIVEDANHTNIEPLVSDVQLILDGTDNFETRYLINDVAVKQGIPWIYGACVSAQGLMLPIVPGQTACLRCLFEQAPPAEFNPTCDTVGVLAPVVNIVASLQCVEAIKILTGQLQEMARKLISVDVWSGRWVGIGVPRMEDCSCCARRRFEYLEGDMGQRAVSLCGRNAVQINQEQLQKIDLNALARKLAPVTTGQIVQNDFMLQADVEGYGLTVFPTGRAIIKGTTQTKLARSIYAKYVGV